MLNAIPNLDTGVTDLGRGDLVTQRCGDAEMQDVGGGMWGHGEVRTRGRVGTQDKGCGELKA